MPKMKGGEMQGNEGELEDWQAGFG